MGNAAEIRGSKRPVRFWMLALAVLAILYPLLAFLAVALRRLNYPLDLEWVEGISLHMANRFAQEQPLYAEPSAFYIPLPYNPLYFVITGLIYRLTGVVYWAGRLVSIVSVLLTGGLVFYIARRETGQRFTALLCSGMWFAAYGYCGFFYDLNRIDALATLFLAMALAASIHRGAVGGLLAGVCLALSALTKQNQAALLAPLLLVLFMRRDWRGVLAASAAFGAVFLPSVWWWQQDSQGWFLRITTEMIAYEPRLMCIWLFVERFFSHYPLFLILLLAYLLPRLRRDRWRELPANPWLVMWIGATGLSFVFQLHTGGFHNANMPSALAAALLLGSLCAAVPTDYPDLWTRMKSGPTWLLPFLIALLLFPVMDHPRRQAPDKEQWKIAKNLHRGVQKTEGLVIVTEMILPEENTLPFHRMSYLDLINNRADVPWIDASLKKIDAQLLALHPRVILMDHWQAKQQPYKNLLAGMTSKKIPIANQPRALTGRATTINTIYTRDADDLKHWNWLLHQKKTKKNKP